MSIRIESGNGAHYKIIELDETDIYYKDIKDKIYEIETIIIKRFVVTIIKNFKLFHKDKCIDMNDEINIENVLTIIPEDEYYFNGKKFENPIKHIENKTLENCKDEISKNVYIIVFPENQTEELCYHAINSFYCDIIHYIRNPTDELCKYAIDKNLEALGFIKNQTKDLCKYAIDKSWYALKYIKNQTDELCKYAIDKDIKALNCVVNQNDELCYYAINKNYGALCYIRHPSFEIYKYAIDKDIDAFRYIKNPTDEVCKYAIDKDIDN